MFRIYLVNFNRYIQSQYSTLEEARTAAKTIGFQSRIEGDKGETYGTHCPIAGWRAPLKFTQYKP